MARLALPSIRPVSIDIILTLTFGLGIRGTTYRGSYGRATGHTYQRAHVRASGTARYSSYRRAKH